MKRATVSRPITLIGPSPDDRLIRIPHLRRPSQVTIFPARTGLKWRLVSSSTNTYPVNIEHLYSHKGKLTGARQIVLSSEKDTTLENKLPKQGEQVYVAEHLFSALNYVGITDAILEFTPSTFTKRKAYVPIMDAGIRTIVEELQKYKRGFGKKVNPIQVLKKDQFSSTDDRGYHTLHIEPASTFEMQIEKSDLGSIGIDSKFLHMQDVYKKLDIDARPVARLDSPLKIYGLKLLHLMGYRGVHKDTYIIGEKDCTEEELVANMRPQFREGKNEQLYHGAIDRSGELFGVAGRPIQGKFHYNNINHITGIDALKHFVKNGSLEYKNL